MAILVVLIVLALLLGGIGAIVEGLLWVMFIGLILLVAAIWFGWSKVRSRT